MSSNNSKQYRAKLVKWVKENKSTNIEDFDWPWISGDAIGEWKDSSLSRPSENELNAITVTEQEIIDADEEYRQAKNNRVDSTVDADTLIKSDPMWNVIFNIMRDIAPLEPDSVTKAKLKKYLTKK